MNENKIQIAHGGGGTLTSAFIREEILSRFGDGPLEMLPDASKIETGSEQILFTTDSFVIQPVFFPGGNIGSLAVHGTVNDLASGGGKPMFLSLALIIEEGLKLDEIRKILDSVKSAAIKCGVTIAAGDTKVVGRGQCDKIYINTAGIGVSCGDFNISRDRLEPGDKVIVSGNLGDHGTAVLAAREDIGLMNGPVSDSAPVHRLVQSISDIAADIKFMRDPTRGGVAAILNETVENSDCGIILDEASIPVAPATRSACEILGLDPLNIACEGRLLAVCAENVADELLRKWRSLPEGENSTLIGEVNSEASMVLMKTVTGSERLVDVPKGELLPRIC